MKPSAKRGLKIGCGALAGLIILFTVIGAFSNPKTKVEGESSAVSPSIVVSPILSPTETQAPSPTPTPKKTATPTPKSTKTSTPEARKCDPNYSGACVPIASDVDCAGGSGNGPAYVQGPVYVIGTDIYDLDRDGDGIGCE